MSENKSIYLFYGSEDFLIDEEIRKLRNKFDPQSSGSLNFEAIDGEKSDPEAIICSLGAVPLLGGDKMVVINNFTGIISSKKEKNEVSDKSNFDPLINVLNNLPKTVTVVFCVKGEIDRRKKLTKSLVKIGNVREFKTFAEWEQDKLLAWILNKVKLCGKKIDSRAARYIGEVSGHNLRALSNEINKIVTYIGNKETIEADDVAAVASSGSISIFSIINSLRERNPKKALESLIKLIKDREDPVALIGLMAAQFRMLLQIKSLEEKGLGLNEIAAELGGNFYFVKKSSEGTHRFTLQELVRNMELLHRADLKLKSTSNSPQSILELLIIEMCSKAEKGAVYS